MDIAGKKIDKEHPNLAGEHPWGDTAQIILLIVFMAVWISDSFILNLTDLSEYYFSYWIKVTLSVIVLICGLTIAKKSSALLFGDKSAGDKVIDQGVFRISRHPLYLSVLIFYLALILFNPTIISLVLFLIIFLFYNRFASYEEELLVERYGDSYREYCKRVARWFPRF